MTFKQYWNAQLERLQKEKKNAPFLVKVLKEECEKVFDANIEANQTVIDCYAELNQFTKKCVDLLGRYAQNPLTITKKEENQAQGLIDAFLSHWQDGLNTKLTDPK
ncbi:MAG: hypothetical protein GWP06_06105 [Actinobacteria bacterium]|nr:hypothetical protein [Actinomycetota bacterium]